MKGVVTAARSRSAKAHTRRAHYCSCGFVGFGNGAEWSHDRRHHGNPIPGYPDWITREQWVASQHRDVGSPGW